MKDKRLLVPVSPKLTTRKFYLRRPPAGRHDWHYCFAPPKHSGAQLKRVFRGTGTSNLAAAKRIASQVIESFYSGHPDAAESLKLRSGFGLLEELIERYQPRPNDVKTETATKNRSAMRVVVRDGLGLESIAAVRVDVLTAELAQRFLDVRERRVSDADELAKERARWSANSTLAQARSLVSPGALYLYDGMKLPDFSGFRSVKRLRVDTGYSVYRPPHPDTIAAIESDARRVKMEQPLVYRAYLLMRYLGLRPSEVWPARRGWIERQPAGSGLLVLRRRADFFTKNRRYRDVPIEPWLMRELDEVLGELHPQAWIINLPTESERKNLLRYDLNRWLRQFFPAVEYEKCSYNLRKHAGSEIADRDGIEAAADFLGDSISVTDEHYRGRLRRRRGLAVSAQPGVSAGEQ